MRILERSVYHGPHLYSHTPMVRIMLDLEEVDRHPTSMLPGFTDRLLEAIPNLQRHGCSLHRPGGFVERMRRGTWIGHVVEHVALELQTLAGSPVSRGKTRSVASHPGVYNVMYAFESDAAALVAGRMALELVSSLLPPELQSIDGIGMVAPPIARADTDGAIPGFTALSKLVEKASFGPTTKSLIDEAKRRGIPYQRLDEYSLVRLGYGKNQRLLRASITGQTPHLAVQIAANKVLAKNLLRDAHVPVPDGAVVKTADETVDAAARIEGPVVTKPLDANHGRGVSLDLVDEADVRRGFAAAAVHSPSVIVEQQLAGRDHRILVIGGEVVAVAERVPAQVVGDGASTVAELIDAVNADPRRGIGHANVMTRITVDEVVAGLLAKQSLTLESAPRAGQVVLLRETANLSTGGEAVDRTDEIHPANIAIAKRAAAIVGLDIAGLDVLTPDISRPLDETGGGIIEVNAAPGFRMHLEPSQGQPRNVAKPAIANLYPRGSSSTIPITAVTGTNGKSTVVRMIGHILDLAGYTVGMTTTSGVYIDGHRIHAVDASGPRSARRVLGDPTIDAAVLETARGGMLREGVAFDRADVGIVLNVSSDHLGLKGVDTLEELAEVKAIVARNVRRSGTCILNADDKFTRRMARHAGGRLAFFTLDGRASFSPALRQHLTDGAIVAAVESGGMLVLYDGDARNDVIEAASIPATLAGAAEFNVQNALAAIIAAYAHGVHPDLIAEALRDFEGSFEQNPGRLNITKAPGFTTILDYAHNPAALRALAEVIATMRPHHDRVIGVVSTPGDRRDVDIREMGRIAATIFDELVFRERPDGRGRAAGGVMALLSEGAMEGGIGAEHVRRVMDEAQAMSAALAMAGPNDLVVLMPTNVDSVWEQIQAFRPSSKPAATPNDERLIRG